MKNRHTNFDIEKMRKLANVQVALLAEILNSFKTHLVKANAQISFYPFIAQIRHLQSSLQDIDSSSTSKSLLFPKKENHEKDYEKIYQISANVLQEAIKLERQLFDFLVGYMEIVKVDSSVISGMVNRYRGIVEERDKILGSSKTIGKDSTSPEEVVQKQIEELQISFIEVQNQRNVLLEQMLSTTLSTNSKEDAIKIQLSRLADCKELFVAIRKGDGPLSTMLELNPIYDEIIKAYANLFKKEFGFDAEVHEALEEFFTKNTFTKLEKLLEVHASLLDFLSKHLDKLQPISDHWLKFQKRLRDIDIKLVIYKDFKRELSIGLGKSYGESHKFKVIPDLKSDSPPVIERGILLALDDLKQLLGSKQPPSKEITLNYFNMIKTLVRLYAEIDDFKVELGVKRSEFKYHKINEKIAAIVEVYFSKNRNENNRKGFDINNNNKY